MARNFGINFAKSQTTGNGIPPGLFPTTNYDILNGRSIYNEINTVALLDSIHDFSEWAFDTIKYSRGTRDNTMNQMIFNALRLKVFPSLPQEYSEKLSNLCWSTGKISSVLSGKDLEDYFLTGILQTLTQTDLYYIKVRDPKTTEIHDTLKRILTEKGWVDEETEKINLLIDTQKQLYSSFNATLSNFGFAYVVTRESAQDPAGKTAPNNVRGTGLDQLVFKSKDNYLYEIGGTGQRIHDNTTGLPGNISVSLGPMSEYAQMMQLVSTYRGKPPFTITMNKSSKHANCISVVKKNIKIAVEIVTKSAIIPPANTPTGVNVMYSTVNRDPVFNTDTNMTEIVTLLTQKRSGDQCQSNIVKMVNAGLSLNCSYLVGAQNSFTGTKTVSKLVLVSIDRMLIAYAALQRIPFIYDGGTFVIVHAPPYSPPLPPPPRRGGTSLSVHRPLSSFNKDPKTKLKLNPVKSIQRGGKYSLRSSNEYNELVETLIENPKNLWKFLPIISEKISVNAHGNTNEKSDFNSIKTLVKNINRSTTTDLHLYLNELNPKNSEVFTTYNDYSVSPPFISDSFVNNLIHVNSGLDILKIYQKTGRRISFKYNNHEYNYEVAQMTGFIGGAGIDDDSLIDFLLETGELDDDRVTGGLKRKPVDQKNRDDDDDDDDDKSNSMEALGLFNNNNKSEKSHNKNKSEKYLLDIIDIILLSQEDSETYNKKLFSEYLQLLQLYEIQLCIDDEQFNMDFNDAAQFNNTKVYPVSNLMYLNVFLKLVLDEIAKLEQHKETKMDEDKEQPNAQICYGLFEYFLEILAKNGDNVAKSVLFHLNHIRTYLTENVTYRFKSKLLNETGYTTNVNYEETIVFFKDTLIKTNEEVDYLLKNIYTIENTTKGLIDLDDISQENCITSYGFSGINSKFKEYAKLQPQPEVRRRVVIPKKSKYNHVVEPPPTIFSRLQSAYGGKQKTKKYTKKSRKTRKLKNKKN